MCYKCREVCFSEAMQGAMELEQCENTNVETQCEMCYYRSRLKELVDLIYFYTKDDGICAAAKEIRHQFE